MKSFLFFMSVLAFLTCNLVAVAQSREGSIGDSWNSAPREKSTVDTKQPQPFLQGEKQYRAWEHRVEETQRTWTTKPQQSPIPRNQQSTNSQLIDSLSTLYCLSSNYLATLRNREEASRMTVPSAPSRPKDFSYQQGPPDYKPLPGRESPEALHKELLQLLEQCLYGRY